MYLLIRATCLIGLENVMVLCKHDNSSQLALKLTQKELIIAWNSPEAVSC